MRALQETLEQVSVDWVICSPEHILRQELLLADRNPLVRPNTSERAELYGDQKEIMDYGEIRG